MLEEQNSAAEEKDFVEAIFTDGTSHSPETPETKDFLPQESAVNTGSEPLPEDDEDDDSFDSPDSGSAPKDAPAAPAPAQADDSALKQEVENLKKRLHDTQAALHQKSQDRAALQKELDALKSKEDNSDDWFSEDDKERKEKLEADLKKSDEEISRVQAESQDLAKQNAVAQWDEAAAPVIKAHPDFEKVMYEGLVPLLDPKTGNPQIRAEWDALSDKSPAAQYEFAKKALEAEEFRRDPAAYKEKMRKEFQHNNNNVSPKFEEDEVAPTGKEALDMMASADMPDSNQAETDFVTAVFGKM